MELDTITIFTTGKGLQEFTKDQFIETLRLGGFDGSTIEIVETRLKWLN